MMRRKIILTIALVLIAAVIIFAILRFSTIVGLLLFGVVLAYLLYPAVQYFTRQGMPSILGILLVYMITATVLIFICVVILPDLYRESSGFLNSLPVYFEHYGVIISRWLQHFDGLFAQTGLANMDDTISAFFTEKIEAISKRSLSYLFSIPQILIALILGPVFSYYFLRDRDKIAARCIEIFPPAKRSTVLVLMKEIDRVLRGFVSGNLFVALIVGSLIALGLSLFGVHYSVILGILAGLFNIIPYFGPILGSIPICFVALLQPGINVVFVLVFVIIIQQVDNIYITPKIIGDKVGMHPVTVIILVLIGGFSGGLIGMILIIPAAAVCKVLLQFFYENFVAFRPKLGEKKD